LLALEYRVAHPDEFALVAALRQEMAIELGDDFDARMPDWRSKFAHYFRDLHAHGRAELFLAFDGNEAIGSAVVSILDDYRNFVFNMKSAWVNAVFVKPAYRRRGIGRELMQMTIAWARERGCRRVRLRTSDDGRELYAAIGFVPGREMELNL
jgi:GNAT superfamily N-acetyltransferase